MRQPFVFSQAMTEMVVEMWRDGKPAREIAAVIERSEKQVKNKIKDLRDIGVDMPMRNRRAVARRTQEERNVAQRLREAEEDMLRKKAEIERLKFPAWVRFEDDPRAILDMGSAYMPRRPGLHYGASSLVGSGRLISSSGKNGAVA